MKNKGNIFSSINRLIYSVMHITLVCIFMLVVSMPASAQVYATSEDNSYNYNAYRSNVYKPGSSTPNSSLGRKSTNAYDPWSGSYAPMRKNSSTGTPGGGALGEDETSENDPEGETGAPDGFITPSDPGHQSNQSPVGEAWVLLFFAAAAALVVFIRQKREKRHIAIYSETQQPSDKSNMKQHIRKSLFISIILLAGVSNAWGATITSDGTARLYFNMSAVDWWTCGTNGNQNFAYFYNTANSSYKWSTHSAQYSGNTYYVVIPKGSWDRVILTRHSVTSNPTWSNFYNQTGNITLSNTSNYISKFSEGSTTVTWGAAVKPTSTASVTACPAKISLQDNSTLTTTLTSNANINTLSKTTYTVNSATGTVSNGKFTATSEGTYTITATVTYHPNGYTSLTSTATATTKITVTSPKTVYLKTNNNWKQDNARFAVYAFNSCGSNTWIDMTNDDLDCNGDYYKAEIPAIYENIIFCRMNPSSNTNGWTQNTQLWNQTGDLTLDNDLFTLSDGSWNEGAWSNYSPTYSVNTSAGTGGTISTSKSSNIPLNEQITVTVSTSPGYTYKSGTITIGTKSATNIPEGSSQYTICGPTEINAEWTAHKYTVSFDENGGSGTMRNQNFTYGSAQNLTANTFTRTGYNFAGWATSANGNKVYDDKQSVSNLTSTDGATVTLYAKWTAIEYTITYENLGGATHSNSGTYTIEDAITFSDPSARNGYTFTGWSPASIAQGSTGNKTITANWTANTYTVAFNANGGTGTMSNQNFTYGTAQNLTANSYTRTGYTFVGWATSANGNKVYNDKQSVNNLSSTNGAIVTLYAKWNAIPYNITYENLGGATHSNPDTYTIEDAITFSAPSDRNGYTFAGWSPASIAKGSMGDKTITANWTEKAANTIYIRANEMWKSNGAKLAVYAWVDEDNTWIDVEYDDCTGDILMADIPAKYTGIKIARLNPNPTSDDTRLNNGYNFDNAWNQTSDLNIPTNNENLYDLTQEYIYLKPNSNWTTADARFAAYFYKSSGGGDTWKDMTDADGDGYYSCEKPDGYDWVIFCRMNPATSANNWNNRWNQSANQGIPENNLFTVNDGQWGGKGEDNNKDGATGHWDNNHWDNSQWTTYTAPTFDVTISAATNGTIKVVYKGQTYTSGQTISNVPIHTELNVTFTPAEGYELTTPLVSYADVVADNIYSICGPTVISAEFVQRGSTKVIYLRPNDDWLKDDAIFIAHAWKNGSSDQHDYLMTTKDTDYTGSYSCTIDSKYDHVLFARINPEYKTNQELKAEWMWNKTIDLQITNDVLEEHGYRFAINSDKMVGVLYDGDWEQNTPIWGLTSDFDSWHAEKAVFMGYPGKLNITLSAGNHEFKLYNFRHDHYYGNNNTYTRANNGQWWTMDFHSSGGNNCTMTADVDNEPYLFQLQLVTETGTYKKQISITYPDFSGGAYRLAYRDNTPNSFHPAHLIRCNTQKDLQLDTISFFVRHDKEPEILLQQCSSADVYTDNPVWTTRAIYPATSSFPSGDNPGNAMLPGKRASDATIHIGEGCGVTSTAVYNFILQQTNTGSHAAALDTRATHLYEGEYYIRTNYAEGGWANYLEPSNLMTYSSYADHYEPFSYYFCKWVNPKNKNEAKANITYTIANPYSRCISDTLIGDAIIAKNGVTEGYLPDSANVRFTWDHETNALARAYIKGSGQAKDRFLVLTGKDDNLKDANGDPIPEGTGNRKGLLANEEMLSDAGNWIYTVDVTANREAAIKLTAKYNDKTQYFKGSESEYTNLLSSTAHDSYKIRIIYDFKTNQLITAWLPDNSKTYEDEALGTNMMIIRTNHEQATQINFTNNKSISDVGIGYAVMTFTKGHVLGSGTQYARSLYWVSFPFDVWLRDVTGFGEYGQHWIMEYYDGASRAQNGLWADSDTYWKYITNPNYKLEAGKGYVLCLNLGKMQNAFTLTDEVSLYFPSTSPLQEISGEVTAAEVPAHTCTIERDNRNIYDSNWNLIGVPGFKDITGVGVGGSAHKNADPNVSEECINFYYKYVAETNKYDATANSKTNDFQIMHSYMVQYAGEILWSSKTFSNPPSSVAARRTGEMPSQHTLQLELLQGEQKADQTIIQLQEQDATADFDMNIDMTKIKNSGANIYTLTENTHIMVAGNALPMEKLTVPVGVIIPTAGEYTFRMPDTDGISVYLMDNETGQYTNMLLNEYTTPLNAGTYENRFFLVLDPNHTATSVDNIGDDAQSKEARIEKFIIDGQLIIRTADGIFDARGCRL